MLDRRVTLFDSDLLANPGRNRRLFPVQAPYRSLPAGLALWLSPWQESYANNDPIGDTGFEAHDWSGNARHFTQSSSGSRPLFKTATLNGQPSFLFDGSNDFLERTAFMAGSAAEIFFTFKIPTGGAWNSGTFGWMKFDGASLASHLNFNGVAYSAFGGTNRTNYNPTQAISENGATMHMLAKGGSNAWFWWENGNVQRANMTQTIDWGTVRHLVGASSGNSNASSISNYWNGHLYDLQIYANELTSTERNTVLAALNSKFGISYTSF